MDKRGLVKPAQCSWRHPGLMAWDRDHRGLREMEGAPCGVGSRGREGLLHFTRTSKEVTTAIWGWPRTAGINVLCPHNLPVGRGSHPSVRLCPADGTGERGLRPGLGGQVGRMDGRRRPAGGTVAHILCPHLAAPERQNWNQGIDWELVAYLGGWS